MLKEKLYNILRDLDSSRNCLTVLEEGVDKKLNRSLNNYLNTIKQSMEYLLARNSYRVLKSAFKEKDNK